MDLCLVVRNGSTSLKTSSRLSGYREGPSERGVSVHFLIPLLLMLVCLMLQACGGSSQGGNTPPPPPPPASPSVSIVSPANNANVTVLPVTLHLSIANTTPSTSFRALLDGVDITSEFGRIADGDVQITVTKPAINFGFNQLQITLGTQRVSTKFSYNPNAVPGAQASTSLAQLVPIRTRVLKTDGNPALTSDWGIELGSESIGIQDYWADPASNCTGACLQVVLLKRTDLSLVSNKVYETGDSQGIANFGAAIAPSQTMISNCGTPGCLEIIQSLGQIGPTECSSASSSSDPNCQCPEHAGGLWGGSYAEPNFVPDCSLANQQANNMTIGGSYGSYFTQIGASSTIAFAANSPKVAYSYIGNVGNGANPFASTPVNTYSPGVFFERLTCSASGADCGNFPNGIDISGSAPASDPTQNGAISGALVLDNNNAYTFTQVAAPVTFTMAVAPDSTSTNPKNLLTISTANPIAGESADNLPVVTGDDGKNHQGGFHVVVFDATTLQNYLNATYTILYSANLPPHVENLSQMPTDLDKFTSRRFLVFIASMGDLYHDQKNYGNTGLSGEDIWDQVAQRIVRLGGTYVTFQMLDNVNFTASNNGNRSGNDDYALAGRPWIIESDLTQPYAAEESSQISRQTSVNPVASNMQGVLKVDRQGYYAPSVHSNYQGFVPDVVTTMASASYQPPVYWPLDGPNDTAGSIAAYQWVSQELCCDDIRSAYANLNAVPDAWLAQMQSLSYVQTTAFTEQDLASVKEQLTLEFKYLSALRQFQSNVTSLYADQQANVGLILQQAQDAVEGAVPIPPDSSSSSASWTGILNDVFNVMGPVGGLLPLADPETEGISGGLYVALGVGSTLLDVASDEANDASGNPLAQQEVIETTASNLAQKAASEYAQNLIALGAQFDRVATDWGRLKTIGSPLINNQIPWDGRATGMLLQSFDLSSRREYFTKLLAANYYIDQLVYASPDSDYNDAYFQGCDWWGVMNDADGANKGGAYGFFPGARIDGPLSTPHPGGNLYPHGIWWDAWFFGMQGNQADCPSISSLAPSGALGLFDPVNPVNPASLGIYKPWFYLRSGLPFHQENKTRYGNYGENGDPPMY